MSQSEQKKQIAIVGNSHVACLKKAWMAWGGEEHIEITFFAATADSIISTTLDRGVIVPTTSQLRHSFRTTSGGRDAIECSNYDALIVYGLPVSIGRLIDVQIAMARAEFVSDGFRHQAVVYSNPSSHHFLKLRAKTPTTRWMVWPRPNTTMPDARSGWDELLLNIDEYESWVRETQRKFAAFDLEFQPQPASTLRNLYLTRPEFSLGAVGLGPAPPQAGYRDLTGDPRGNHMNADYGRIVLGEIIDRIVTKPA